MFLLHVDEDIQLRLHDTYRMQAFYNLIDANRKHIGQWMEWTDYHQSVSNTYDYILWERENFAKGEIISTQIIYQGDVAGSVSLTITDAVAKQGEIGYWLGRAFTGKGIATRAAQAMVNFAFNTLGLYKLVIRAISDNTASIAVGERLGFHYEGIQVKQRYLRGSYYDYHVQYILRDQWVGIDSPEFEHRLDEDTVLRPLMTHHAEQLFACVDTHRDSLREWVAWVDAHTSLTDSDDYIDRAMEKYGAFTGLDCGIWHKEQFGGQVNYNDWIIKRKTGDIGYWLAPPLRGKGIMTKAVRAMLDYGFTVVGLHRITLYTATENTRSTALAKRVGFTHEGVLRRGERIRHTFYDAHVFSMLSTDWDSQ